jgi:23S rRNA pseudouridine2605 synthase
MADDSSTRLNKFLALNLGVSRREADKLISYGKIKINGKMAEIGNRVSKDDKVELYDKPINQKTSYTYIALHKPIGYVCSRKQQGDSPTVYDLLPKELQDLKTVGRLDRDSSGLLLLSDDGDFTYQMTHPKFYKVKTYWVMLDKELAPLHQQMISDYGVSLEDGNSKLTLERKSDDNRYEWIVTMHEGRNRQIRRTFGALGYNVQKLHRTNFGNYALGDIPVGKYISFNIL